MKKFTLNIRRRFTHPVILSNFGRIKGAERGKRNRGGKLSENGTD